MTELNITLDDKALAKLRRLAAVSRMEAAKALTFTAEKAVPAWKAGQAVFHKRNTWIDRGVRMRAATPSSLNAQVGTLDKFMGRHVVGLNDPKLGNLFIPIYRSIGEARKHNVERRALARMATTKRKPFLLHAHGDTFLARRKGKARAPLTILGKLQHGARVKPELDALAIVDRVVQVEFTPIYERLIIKWSMSG